MGFDTIPSNGNFSDWRSLLSDKADICDKTFVVASDTAGKSIFDGLSSAANAVALEEALTPPRAIMDYVFKHKGGEVAFLIIAIVLLIAGIVASWAWTKCFRKGISKIFCGQCRSRSRVRMHAVQPHTRSFLVIANVLGAICTVVCAVLIYVFSAQGISGQRAGKCNLWMQLYGHFFGTEKLHRGDYTDIAWAWEGSYNMLEELNTIERETQLMAGANHSQIYDDLYKAYMEMRVNAEGKVQETNAFVTDLRNYAQVWRDTCDLATDVNAWKANGFQQFDLDRARELTSTASMAKADIFVAEATSTLTNGWVEMERILEEYAGNNATLTLQAKESIQNSRRTITDLDLVLAKLTQLVDQLLPALDALVYLFISLQIISASVAIIVAALVLWQTFRLLKSLRHDGFPIKRDRQVWAASYSTWCVLAGLFALCSAGALLSASIGKDACLTIGDAVFERGNWAILGNDILQPKENMQVNVNVVLDTCIREDGSGDVAAALGLDGEIRTLSVNVDAAKVDVSATRDRVLNKQEKGTRAQVLAVGFGDIGTVLTYPREDKSVSPLPGDPSKSGFASRAFFNSSRLIRPDYDPNIYNNGAPKSILCLVPRLALPTTQALAGCISNGLQYDVSPMNVALDDLNAAVTLDIVKPVNMPAAFCSDLLANLGHPCAQSVAKDSPGWLKTLTPDQTTVNTWIDATNALADVVAAEAGSTLFRLGDKIGYAIYSIQRLQGLLEVSMADVQTVWTTKYSGYDEFNTTVPDLTPYCPDGDLTSCSFVDAKNAVKARMTTDAPKIYPYIQDLFALVDAYVDDTVIPKMDSLVSEANTITAAGNCQFEGTAMKGAVMPPLCESVFPAFALTAILNGLASVVAFLFAIHCWKWCSFMEDIAADCLDSPENYALKREPSTMMRDRIEFTQYTGVPTTPTDTRVPGTPMTPGGADHYPHYLDNQLPSGAVTRQVAEHHAAAPESGMSPTASDYSPQSVAHVQPRPGDVSLKAARMSFRNQKSIESADSVEVAVDVRRTSADETSDFATYEG